jgi:3-hydroxybutyrate dehydrogenase
LELEEDQMTIAAPARSFNTAGNLAGKVALVTGSTSGIGLGIARALAQAGASVVLNGFGAAEEIERLRAELEATYATKVLYSPADMSKPESIEGMIEMTAQAFGRLDILVNNAGIQHVAPIEQFPVEKWDLILAINLSSAFHTTRLALAHMRRNRWGRIINIASAHGLVASPFKAAYVAAKHAVIGLTKVVALETAEEGITCNAVCPGYVFTPLVEAQIDGQAKAHNLPRDRVVREVSAEQAFCDGRGDGRHRRLPGQRGRGLHHRRRLAGRWWLDGPLTIRDARRLT